MKTIAAGSDIDAHCTKCKLDLAHVIIAMVGTRVVRVQCKTCGTVHAFRGGKRTGNTKETSKRKTLKRSATALAASDYDRLMRGRDISQASAYKAQTAFEKDQVLDHPKFGIGLVLRILQDNKIEAAFPMGVKILVHNRS